MPLSKQFASNNDAGIDWSIAREDIERFGCSVLSNLVSSIQCAELIALYADESRFHKRVVMAQHGFGRGEYKYFAYPLPLLVAKLRDSLYPPLAEIGDGWNAALKNDSRYPPAHAEYLKRCHDAGQAKPTPLLLRYSEGDYNCLHQDLYGALVFPLQVAILLSRPGEDFSGGELVLTEQRPRMQSRADVVPLSQGDAVIFVVNERPVHGTKGYYRVKMRHGVSRLRSGSRFTLGIIFHDAR